MTVSLANAPLVEIIVELRWNPGEVVQTIPDQPLFPGVLAGDTKKIEEFFMHFGGGVHGLGFERAERMVPANFPMIPFQPIFRFRKPEGIDASVLFQVGVGSFSAHVIPPYENWKAFAPIVRQGVNALLKARGMEKGDVPFSAVSLRYIDVFGPDLTQDMRAADFIGGVLGFDITLPAGVSKYLAAGEQPKPFLQFQIPMRNRMLMSLGLGEGIMAERSGIIFDTTVATTVPTAAGVDAVMSVVDDAHDAIHDMFFDITAKLMEKMGRQEEATK